jgi:hypothetical protein
MRLWLAAGLLAAAVAAAPTPARANDDAVQFFSNIHVTPDAPVHDAVCFFCSVEVDGKVTGDIVSFFGSVHISGEAQRDVVSFFGSVRIDDNATIGRDLVSILGSVRLGENSSVGRDAVSLFGNIHAPASAHIGGDRVSIPAIIFYGPLLLIIGIIVLIVHEIRSRRYRWPAGYPPPPPMQ